MSGKPPAAKKAGAAAKSSAAVKKPNKAIAALKEQLAKQKELDEKLERERQEAIRLAEEEARKERERIAAEEAEKERRKEQRRLEREQLRKEGKLLSKTEREKQKKAELFKQQLIAQGLPLPIEGQKDKDKKPKLGTRIRKHRDKNGEAIEASNTQTATQPIEANELINGTAEQIDNVTIAEKKKINKLDKKTQLAMEAQRIREEAAAAAAAKEASRLNADEDDERAQLEQWKREDESEQQHRSEEDRDISERRKQEDAALKAEFDEEERKLRAEEQVAADSWEDLADDDEEETNEDSGGNKELQLEELKERQKQRLNELHLQRHTEDGALKSTRAESDSQKQAERAAIQQQREAEKNHKEERQAELKRQQETEEAAAAKARAESRNNGDLRSPICCILGHVDTGKTKLLDKIRSTNVQGGEAGGITQQIGATFFPAQVIQQKTQRLMNELQKDLGMKAPGLLIIDTPGHESFTNLRSRGNNLCDIAILVVDIMHGLEQQTIESINLLKQKKTPFVVALNKIDRCYDWKPESDAPFRSTLNNQKQHTQNEFEKRCNDAIALLAAQSLNCALYYKNPDPRKYVSIVPTSAITGEGVPDLLMLIVRLTQTMMSERLSYISELQATVLEVKVVEGHGTTIDVVLVNGVINEGDTIVVCGLQGPIVTTIRALLTPPPLAELRVKSDYIHHKSVKAAMGVKISAQGLESAVAGSQLLVCKPKDDIEELKDIVMQDLASIFSKADKCDAGVCVQASTLGSLEALLSFLSDMKIPVVAGGIALGPVHKKDVMRASVMLQKKPEYAIILAFDVKVDREAQELADKEGVKIFTADIIYHLFDQCTAYMERIKAERRAASADTAVFPCILEILPNCIFNAKNPLVLGCRVVEGIAKVGTPLCVPSKNMVSIGRIVSIEVNHEPVQEAKKGAECAFKIEQVAGGQIIVFGRHFDEQSQLVSRLSRESIDLLKSNFKDDLTQDDWKLVIKLKKVFDIM